MPTDLGTFPYLAESIIAVLGSMVFSDPKTKPFHNLKCLNVEFTKAGAVLKRILEGMFPKQNIHV